MVSGDCLRSSGSPHPLPRSCNRERGERDAIPVLWPSVSGVKGFLGHTLGFGQRFGGCSQEAAIEAEHRHDAEYLHGS